MVEYDPFDLFEIALSIAKAHPRYYVNYCSDAVFFELDLFRHDQWPMIISYQDGDKNIEEFPRSLEPALWG